MSEPGDSAGVDDGQAIHYLAVAPGTPVYSSDGTELGVVREILDNAREHIFDGIVFRAADGSLRFADAPEVARTAERGVTLTLSAERAADLGPPETGGAFPKPAMGRGGGSIFGRIFGRGRS